MFQFRKRLDDSFGRQAVNVVLIEEPIDLLEQHLSRISFTVSEVLRRFARVLTPVVASNLSDAQQGVQLSLARPVDVDTIDFASRSILSSAHRWQKVRQPECKQTQAFVVSSVSLATHSHLRSSFQQVLNDVA